MSKKKQIEDVANKSEDIGNICYENFKRTKKTTMAKVSIAAYRNVLYANNILLKLNKENL